MCHWCSFLTLRQQRCCTLWSNPFCLILSLKNSKISMLFCAFSNSWEMFSSAHISRIPAFFVPRSSTFVSRLSFCQPQLAKFSFSGRKWKYVWIIRWGSHQWSSAPESLACCPRPPLSGGPSLVVWEVSDCIQTNLNAPQEVNAQGDFKMLQRCMEAQLKVTIPQPLWSLIFCCYERFGHVQRIYLQEDAGDGASRQESKRKN